MYSTQVVSLQYCNNAMKTWTQCAKSRSSSPQGKVKSVILSENLHKQAQCRCFPATASVIEQIRAVVHVHVWQSVDILPTQPVLLQPLGDFPLNSIHSIRHLKGSKINHI